MTFVRHDGNLHLELPPELTPDLVPWPVRRVTGPLEKSTLDIMIRRREDSAEFFVPTTFSATSTEVDAGRVSVTYTGQARLNPALAASGMPLWPGSWDLYVLLRTVGLDKQVRLGATRAPSVPRYLTGHRTGRRLLAQPYWTAANDNLSIKVATLRAQWRRVLARGTKLARRLLAR